MRSLTVFAQRSLQSPSHSGDVRDCGSNMHAANERARWQHTQTHTHSGEHEPRTFVCTKTCMLRGVTHTISDHRKRASNILPRLQTDVVVVVRVLRSVLRHPNDGVANRTDDDDGDNDDAALCNEKLRTFLGGNYIKHWYTVESYLILRFDPTPCGTPGYISCITRSALFVCVCYCLDADSSECTAGA